MGKDGREKIPFLNPSLRRWDNFGFYFSSIVFMFLFSVSFFFVLIFVFGGQDFFFPICYSQLLLFCEKNYISIFLLCCWLPYAFFCSFFFFNFCFLFSMRLISQWKIMPREFHFWGSFICRKVDRRCNRWTKACVTKLYEAVIRPLSPVLFLLSRVAGLLWFSYELLKRR